MATHVITGAGSGIGATLTERLAERGDELWLWARDTARADELRERFPGARTIACDLEHPDRMERALADQELPERIDGLIHSAGAVNLRPIAELRVATWQAVLNVNLTSPAEITRLLLPALRRASGHVVFVNSGAGLRANPYWAAYAASKHGLKALADALRAEEREHGLRVTSVYPGRTATPMQERVHRLEGREYDAGEWMPPSAVAETILMALDLPRPAEVLDLSVRPGA
ncbi:SDR family oxidoreductase [Streptomyces alkaliphilus]|uniref:SDR family oxidoreductase n=1 Tax=Streptomyces alkaliphilus TaxID=1472722 RepID=UPI00117ED89A|nr:SDR family oxidoreductase [Streptomyces alkaliphilus]MQS05849.1 SDR family oxidoreductase [Streptomyces alkaliphilus]